MRRHLASLLALSLGAAVLVPGTLATAAPPGPEAAPADLKLEPADPDAQRPLGRIGKERDPGVYLIRLRDEPVATYRGGAPGHPATSPQATGDDRLDARSPNARAYQGYLEDRQDEFVQRAERRLGRPVDAPWRYFWGNNGVAMTLTPEEAARVARMPEVVFLQRDFERELHTDNGPAWIGAPAIWDDPGDIGNRGEGIVVGIVDTGITPSNPSFAEMAEDGYLHEWAGNFFGVCDPGHDTYDPAFVCNGKLIGMYGFATTNNAEGDPLDWAPHGTHVAGTAAGNPLLEAEVVGNESPPFVLQRAISGVAPRAHIISYSGCCTLSGLSRAIDQAIMDGVDVINYSIGSTAPSDLWNDFDTVGYLSARAAGIFVATSAGNSGPGPATVGSPGDAPWITTVAASTHDRQLQSHLVDMGGGDTAPPPDLVGRAFSSGHGPAPIVYAAAFETGPDAGQCLEEFPAGTWTSDEIVVCDRGVIARVQKGLNVLAGGAGGLVLANTAAEGDSLNGDAHYLPAVHITYDDGVLLKDWLATGENHTAEITGTIVAEDPAFGDVMAAFSSRGPNRAVDTITPDVTAPGVDILAAYGVGDPDPAEWSFISGTSMSSPHVAGAGALLMAAHPDWTPAEIQSALMTTANRDVLKHDGATPADPFDVGSGRVDLAAAALAGILLDETIANYENANPDEDGDPTTLNLASMADSFCLVECGWTRTVRSAVDSTVEWTVTVEEPAGVTISVEPASFALNALGESQTLDVTADVQGAGTDVWLFGHVVLTPDDLAIPTAHLPIAVMPTSGVLPNLVEIDTRRDAGSQLVTDLLAIEITELRVDPHGLVRGNLHTDEVSEDPVPGDPYSDLDDVWWTTLAVPGNALYLLAEILAWEAPDLDLYVGTGDTPSAPTEVCNSASPHSAERCVVDHPDEGTWWVLVQSWAGSGDQPDAFTLVTAVVPEADAGNLDAEGPTSQPEAEPFDLRVFFDEPLMEAGDRWYGAISLGSDMASPGNLGTFPVEIARHADDVTKVADRAMAGPGETVTYTIAVEPNVRPFHLEYTLTDVIPEGLTYVPGSATGGATVEDGVLSWSGTMPAPELTYQMATIDTDPACRVPLSDDPINTGSGGYLNLVDFGVFPNPAIDGDSFWFTAFGSGAPFQYWGSQHQGLDFVSTGVAFFDSTPGATFWDPQAIPDPADPNNTLAMFWADLDVVYDDDPHRGVTLVALGPDGQETGPDSGVIVDYKGVEPWPRGSTSERYDFQMFMWRSVGPGYDIVFAYDNLGDLTDPAVSPLTVGLEDALGEDAVALLSRESGNGVLYDGFAVCFDFQSTGGDPVEITYEVTVDADASGTLVNLVTHDVDDPGSREETTSAPLVIAVLESIVVTPANPTVVVGDTQQFTATGHYDDSSTANLTSEVAWSVTDGSVAGISGTGLATGLEPGTTQVRATVGAVVGSTNLTVVETTPAPASIEVAFDDAAPTIGEQFDLTVTVTDGEGDPVANQDVVFEVDGANSGVEVHTNPSGIGKVTGTTGSEGTASFWYVGENAGTDTITVFADLDGDGVHDAGEPMAQFAVTWQLPADSATRLAGDDRIRTAVAVSVASYGAGEAGAVVLARADTFPDALAGTPLAVARDAPMLLTFPAELHAATEAELGRVLPPGRTVYVLGGPAAVSPAVSDRLVALGYVVERIAGDDRYETAVEIAKALGAPSNLLVTTGQNFPDALAAGAAAAANDGAVLLTPSETRHPTTDAYLASRPGATVYGVGGPAARPYAEAIQLIGIDREATARMVAETFFDEPSHVGIARRDDFPDALTGGAHIGRLGGAMLLTASDQLHPTPAGYLCDNHATIYALFAYGGVVALHQPVFEAAAARISGTLCG